MCWKKLHIKRSESKPKQSCPYGTIDDCPHRTPDACGYDISSCLHKSTKKVYKTESDPLKLKLVLWGVVALLVFVIAKVGAKVLPFAYSDIIYNDILASLSVAVLVGVVLTFVIDLPTRLNDYEKSFVRTLSSNDYLKTLDEQKLTKLRNDVTEQLHKSNAPRMEKDLILMDQKICDLLRSPYYSRYRQSVVCEKPDGNNIIVKEHTIDYQLINPYGDIKEAKELLRMSNLVKLDKIEDAEKEKVIELKEFTCSIDDAEPIDFLHRSTIEYEAYKKKDEYYNTKACLNSTTTDNESNGGKGVPVMFKNNIQVHMRYSIKVHGEDRCFSKRLQYPAKNFRLDYTSKDEKVKLSGQIFGTEMKQSNMFIRSNSNNSVSLECFDLLLPQNGAMVVML